MRVGRPFADVPVSDFEPALSQHPLQRRIKRAFFNLQQVVGNLFNVLHQRIAVHRLQAQRLQDHDLQRAWETDRDVQDSSP